MRISKEWIMTILSVVWGWIKGKKETWEKVAKIVQPLMIEVERLALDGVIDKADRKVLVLKAVALLEADGTIKLNFITRWMLNRVIDSLSKKIPDFNVSKNAKEIIEAVNKNQT